MWLQEKSDVKIDNHNILTHEWDRGYKKAVKDILTLIEKSDDLSVEEQIKLIDEEIRRLVKFKTELKLFLKNGVEGKN